MSIQITTPDFLVNRNQENRMVAYWFEKIQTGFNCVELDNRNLKGMDARMPIENIAKALGRIRIDDVRRGVRGIQQENADQALKDECFKHIARQVCDALHGKSVEAKEEAAKTEAAGTYDVTLEGKKIYAAEVTGEDAKFTLAMDFDAVKLNFTSKWGDKYKEATVTLTNGKIYRVFQQSRHTDDCLMVNGVRFEIGEERGALKAAYEQAVDFLIAQLEEKVEQPAQQQQLRAVPVLTWGDFMRLAWANARTMAKAQNTGSKKCLGAAMKALYARAKAGEIIIK